MTVTSPLARNDYTGAGSTGPFVYGFRIYVATDLQVTTQDPSGNVRTLATGADYSVTGVGVRTGGTITLTVALAVGWKMTILRVRPFTQLINYRNQGAGFPQNIEDGFDQVVMLAQQLQIDTGQAITVPVTAGAGSTIGSYLPGYYLRVNLAGTGVEGVAQVVAAQNYLGSGTGAVVRSANAKMGDVVSVKDFGATGNGTTDDTAFIQAAITATPIYGALRIPIGTYLVTGTLFCPNPIKLLGDGAGSQFLVASSVGSTTDIFNVKPTTDGHFYQFDNFRVTPKSTAAGRHHFYIDGSVTNLSDALFTRLQLNSLGNGAVSIFGTGNGSAQGTIIISQIADCIIQDGISLQQCGDTVMVLRNHMNGANAAVDVAFIAGSSTFVLASNSITNNGGVHFGANTIAAQIIGNECETFNTFTGSNGAFIDVDGSATDVVVALNSFQIVNGITTNSVRVNSAARTNLYGNRFGRGASTSNDILITASAVDTMIGTNQWATGVPLGQMVNNAGTTTMWTGAFNAAWYSSVPMFFNVGASGVDTEQIRFGRTGDFNRYNSIHSDSNSSGAATMSVWIHNGVTATSQVGAMLWDGLGRTFYLTLPSIFANNAAAIAGGLSAGGTYRTGNDPDVLCVVH